jgi:hypothetical protein
MNNRKYQIFISSTYSDLIDERQAAVEAILKAGHIPAGMELFAAGNESQMETIKRWIETSDIYMLILGGRYGSVEPKTGLSYMELEYDYACSLEKPVFAVVIDEKALDEKVKKVGKEAIETSYPQQYQSFRKKVLSRVCAFFRDTKDIKLAVHESIPNIEGGFALVGWVPASEVQDTKSLISEINRLLGENTALKQENEALKKALQEPSKQLKKQDYEELINVLNKIELESVLFDTEGKVPKKLSLLTIFYSVRDSLVTGVTNQYGMGDLEKLLYFNVCPKLQIYGLMVNMKVPGVQYRRFSVTTKGLDLLAYIEKDRILKKDSSRK